MAKPCGSHCGFEGHSGCWFESLLSEVFISLTFLPYSMSGAFPGEGNGYQLQCSCLESSMYRGAWWAVVHGVTKSWTQLNN